MNKKKTIDKQQARERRDHLLKVAAAGQLSVREGVREMRAIAGMTQEEFARHRGVSARVIKAIELDQGNPTMATLNRIAGFFGLEVALVPARKTVQALPENAHGETADGAAPQNELQVLLNSELQRSFSDAMVRARADIDAQVRKLTESFLDHVDWQAFSDRLHDGLERQAENSNAVDASVRGKATPRSKDS